MFDERQRPRCRLVEGLLPARLGRHHPSRFADRGDCDPGRCAPGGVRKLGSQRLELSLQLGDMAACRLQLVAELVRLIAMAGHGAKRGDVAAAISSCIERRW